MPSDSQEAAVSSSSTIWAKASKEWVIPARPKPGRKLKKDTTPPTPDDSEVNGDGKARRTQNRAAQRAFRERKTSQLAELQARIQTYEQEEVERNVVLQNIAKRLKEENESLRKENIVLGNKLSKVAAELEALQKAGQKRGRTEADVASCKRSRLTLSPEPTPNPSTWSYPYCPRSPSSVSTSDSVASPRFSSLSLSEAPRDKSPQPLSVLDPEGIQSTTVFDSGSSFNSINYCLCNEKTTPCACREVAMRQAADNTPLLNNPGTKPETTSSILDNLPVYQPSIPLPRRTVGRDCADVFPISQPTCTGDPRHCDACAADDFGKAFCAAVNKSATVPCESCPGLPETSLARQTRGSSCCMNQPQCGRTASSAPLPIASAAASKDMISCDDAWRQLKSHPNVEFSDLSLLAEVVARRSKCTGSQVVISPAPGSITPERTSTRVALQSIRDPETNEEVFTNRAPDQQEPPSPARLVPEAVLARYSREPPVRTVHVDAVQAALRLLDAKSTFYRK